jgi:hypothetical protein
MSEETQRCKKCGENRFNVAERQGKGERLELWCSSCGALVGFMLPDYESGEQTRWRFITGTL